MHNQQLPLMRLPGMYREYTVFVISVTILCKHFFTSKRFQDFEIWYEHGVWLVVLFKNESASSSYHSLYLCIFLSNKIFHHMYLMVMTGDM